MITPQQKSEFLEKIVDGVKKITAAGELGLSIFQINQALRDDENFSELYKEAQAAYIEKMEEEADRRAIKGVSVPIISQGEIIGYKREFSDSLLMFRLMAENPDKYKKYKGEDKIQLPVPVQINVNVKDGKKK